MEQLGRRAVALDVSLMSKQPGERRCYRLCSGFVLEKRWKTFESRAAQVALILLLSAGEARGVNSICKSVLDLLRRSNSLVYICFELCCLIVGEIFFQSTQLSGVC